jgi:S-(hydroxymethyl)glutathione dehydrogenase/alcohol dehydrogenase
MKAVVLTELNKPLKVCDITPMPLSIGQVLVKVLVSGVCGSQLLEIKGYKGNAKFLPHLMGHEGCGIVSEVGQGVTRVKVGDKVVMHWMKTEGIESPFPAYKYENQIISSGKVTTLSEFSVVSENRLTPVPPDTNENLCALLGCCLTTGLGAVVNDANIKMGESVLVLGCGGVGLSVVLGASIHGACPIVVSDISDDKQVLAYAVGATRFINPHTSGQIKDKFDVIIDTTGACDLIGVSMEMLADSGRYILVGQGRPNDTIHITNFMHLFGGKGKTIKASQGGATNPAVDIPRYIKMAKYGLINVDNMITNILPLEDINEAVELMNQSKTGRVIIKI